MQNFKLLFYKLLVILIVVLQTNGQFQDQIITKQGKNQKQIKKKSPLDANDCIHDEIAHIGKQQVQEKVEFLKQTQEKRRNLIGIQPEIKTFKRASDYPNEVQPIRITLDFQSLDLGVRAGKLPEKQVEFLKENVKVAQTYYQKRLKVIRYKSGEDDFLKQPDRCVNYKDIPGAGQKVMETDFHVYVTAELEENKQYLAYATFCDEEVFYDPEIDPLNYYTDRPTIAQLNFNTYYLEDIDDPAHFQKTLQTTLHELAHALGFSNSVYREFRKENSEKYGEEAVKIANVRGLETLILATKEVRKWGANHFGCDKLLDDTETNQVFSGMQLENQGGSGSKNSHWERTMMYDEIMTASSLGISKSLTGATFALFEDSGWYVVDSSRDSKSGFGYKKGCSFLEHACNDQNQTYDEFCKENNEIPMASLCTYAADSIGICTQQNLEQYFMDSNCGIVPPFSNGRCIDFEDSQYDTNYSDSGQLYQYHDSRCFDSNLSSPIQAQNNVGYGNRNRCYKFECLSGNVLKIVFTFKDDESENGVREEVVACNKKGETHKDIFGLVGILTCPDPVEYCQQGKKYCKNQCSSKGYCQDGLCNCINGYGGEDCSVKGSDIPSCNTNGKSIDELFLKDTETECFTDVGDDKCCVPQPGNQYCNVYGNKFNRKCEFCHANCLTCSGGDYNDCKTCQKYWFLQEGTCVQYCSPRYLADEVNSVCLECQAPDSANSNGFMSGQCYQCEEIGKCSECNGDNYLDTEGRCLKQEECSETLRDNFSKKCYNTCPPTRIQQGNNCERCQENQYMDIDKNICIKKEFCPEKTYANDEERVCSQCDDRCVTCFGPGYNFCYECKPGYYKFGFKCILNDQCPLGSYSESLLNICRSCHKRCISCTAETHNDCSKCVTGYYLENTSCVEKCSLQLNTYTDNITNKCEQCHQSCASCFNQFETGCNTCYNPNYLLILSFKVQKCVSECPEGFYLFQNQCLQCHQSCKTCFSYGNKFCYTCGQGYLEYQDFGKSVYQFESQLICVQKCPDSYYPSEFNSQEVQQNLNKIGNQNKVIKKDDENNSDNNIFDGESNFEQNIQGKEQNKVNLYCRKCHGSCQVCNGPTDKDCLLCNKYLYLYQGQCIRQCPSGMLIDEFFRKCQQQQIILIPLLIFFILIIIITV